MPERQLGKSNLPVTDLLVCSVIIFSFKYHLEHESLLIGSELI